MRFELYGYTADGKRVRVLVSGENAAAAIERARRNGVEVDPDVAPRQIVEEPKPVSPSVSAHSTPAPQSPTAANSPARPSTVAGRSEDSVGADATSNAADAAGGQRQASQSPSVTEPRPTTHKTRVTAIAGIAALGGMLVASVLFFTVLAVWRADSPTGAGAPSAQSPEQLLLARRTQATVDAWNAILTSERSTISKFSHYDPSMARAIVTHYRQVNLQDADHSLKVWVYELVEAAQAVLDVESSRREQLAAIESGRDQRARTAGGNLGQFAFESEEGSLQKLVAGAAGAAVGAIGSNVFTERAKAKVNEEHNARLSAAQWALKAKHETRRSLGERLARQYGWTTK